MKYISKNQTKDFEFHDTSIISSRRVNNSLFLTTKFLCIHENSANNPFDTDMEIDFADITLENFLIKSYKEFGYIRYDQNTKEQTKVDDTVIYGTEAVEKFNLTLENNTNGKLRFNYFEKNEEGYYFEVIYPQGIFSIKCYASAVKIEWDEFKRPAWYLYRHSRTRPLILMTEKGEETSEVTVYYNDSNSDGLDPSLSLTFMGKNYFSLKRYYNFDELFAEMQNQLPENIFIKCCVTCRHGNFCPFGNIPDEIFCTKDVIIRNKDDACRYTSDDNRKKVSTYCCQDYKPQSKNFYTYNDFLHYVNKYKL